MAVEYPRAATSQTECWPMAELITAGQGACKRRCVNVAKQKMP